MADIKAQGGLIGVIADEARLGQHSEVKKYESCKRLCVGHVDLRKKTNYLVVDGKTTTKQIEATFKEFTLREDMGIILISQYVANMIRPAIEKYNKPAPAILEIPSKDCPYDPTQDSILSRVQFMFGAS